MLQYLYTNFIAKRLVLAELFKKALEKKWISLLPLTS